MNHTNFTRWLPVHLRDMKLLHVLSPRTEANEQVRSAQRNFHQNVKSLTETLSDLGSLGSTNLARLAVKRFKSSSSIKSKVFHLH